MRTEEEIREVLRKCDEVRDWGLSNGPCPIQDVSYWPEEDLEKHPEWRRGCCAECSFPSTIVWVLGEDVDASANGQSRLINALRGEDDEE